MARVTYGSGVTELAGSIGGVTYQKNASGNTAKLRANPTVNPSALQSAYHNRFSFLVSYWPTLSQANKDLWDALALANDHTTPWGEIKTLSGYQWFLSCNLTRSKFDDIVITAPLAWEIIPPADQFTLVATATYLRVEWAPAYTPPRELMFYLSLPLRQSSIKLRRSLFYVGNLIGAGAMTEYDLTAWFVALTGVVWADFFASADCSIICRVIHTRSGKGYTSSFTSSIVKI